MAFQRSNTIQTSSVPILESENLMERADKRDFQWLEVKFKWPLRIPSSTEAAVSRITHNLSHHALFYAHFVWIILAITLIPKRKVSFICLTITTYASSVYLLLLRSFPDSYLLHVLIDKRLVLSIFVLAMMIEVAATGGGLHLVFTLVGSIPVIFAHAILWVNEKKSVEEDDFIHEEP